MANPATAVWHPIVTEIVRERIGAGEPAWLPVRGLRELHVANGVEDVAGRAQRILDAQAQLQLKARSAEGLAREANEGDLAGR